jgi:hypothetical protein
MYNGGIFGKKNSPNVFNANGIWHLKQVAGYIERGEWYFARSATVNATSFLEGDTITVTINAPSLPDGTKLYWTINTVSGTIRTDDFDNRILNGPLSIINGKDTTSRKLETSKQGDGARSFTIAIRTESVEGPVIATTPVLTLDDVARGGNAVFDRGGYRYHKFTSSGNFFCNRSLGLTVFAVGGGGGGGGNGGGGGGGGGIVYTNISVGAGTYFISIGGGGSAAPNGSVHGGSGGNTTFQGFITANGGGGGGSRDTDRNGYFGGSGGGGSSNGGGGGGTPGQGNGGGNGIIAGAGEVQSTGGGGGGYGGGGQSGAAKDAGNGGPGGAFDPTADGTAEYYSGGGGGGRTVFGTTGANGQGQGANRGGGGKGGSGGATSFAAQAGDTGYCVVRYLIPSS